MTEISDISKAINKGVDIVQQHVKKVLYGTSRDQLDHQIFKLLVLPQIGALLYTVLDLKIPQILASGPKTAQEISQETLTSSEKLERVLLALETKKIFDFNPVTSEFSLNKYSENFLKESYVDYIKHHLNSWQFDLLSMTPKCIKSDKTAPEEYYNNDFINFLGQKPLYLEQFTKGLYSHVVWLTPELLQLINLSNSQKVLDVAGHGGALSIELSKHYSNFNSTVYDISLFREVTEKNISLSGLENRIKFITGDYFSSIPSGFDTIVTKCLSEQNNDSNLDKILSNIRQATDAGTRFFLIEVLLDKHDPLHQYERFMDISALTLCDGKVRRKEELEEFLTRNGFRLISINPVKSDWVIEAVAV